MINYEQIRAGAVATLEQNRLPNGVICPQIDHFGSSFKWDAGTIALGLATYDALDAADQLDAHMIGAHPDGLISNEVVFGQLNFAQKKILRFHQFSEAGGTSNITQPPNLAHGVRVVAESLPEQQQLAYLQQMFPPLAKEAEWLLKARTDSQDGLITLVHPYESGMDNSPIWDEPMARAWDSGGLSIRQALFHKYGPKIVERFRKQGGDLQYADLDVRSQNGEIANSLLQSWELLKYDHDLALIKERGRSALVKDIGFNAIAAFAFEDLAWIESAIDNPRYTLGSELNEAIQRQKEALWSDLWDESERAYFGKDARTGEPIKKLTVGSLLPLLIEQATERTDRILQQITDPELFWTESPITSVATNQPEFNPQQYWRGGAWSLTRVFVFEALLRQGHYAVADDLATKALSQPHLLQFGEYNNAITGEALGMMPFSPAAAEALVYIDYLTGKKDSYPQHC